MFKFEFIDPFDMISSEEFEIIESFKNTVFKKEVGWHYITRFNLAIQTS